MKRSFLKFIIFTVICISLNACNDLSQNNVEKELSNSTKKVMDLKYHKKNFDSLITYLDFRYNGNLDFNKGLMSDTIFREIYDHSSFYSNDLIEFLLQKKVLYQNEKSNMLLFLSIWAMQNLPLPKYSKFCNTLLNLYENKVVNEDVVHEAITPNFQGKWIIPTNYKDPIVIRLLKRIINNENISPEFKKEIETILSGEFINNINQRF